MPARKAPQAPPEPARKPRQQARGHMTTIDLPDYVVPQISEFLARHPEMRFRQAVLLGLSKLGIEVKPEDLVAKRGRGIR
ncbi:MAG: hypothetical protein K2X74_12815 [Acetobacteraceae bacterium]|nr:hypothetical protein [Acetobacteraceae bacterium]